ncbi:MAG: hypothetical protein VB086_00790 [Clostridiaceae bacterium]|nr:hypothetical protein [Clostridiaceae bacterium]
MKRRLSLFLCGMSLLLLFGCVPSPQGAEEPADTVLTDEDLRACYLAALDEWVESQTLMEIDHISIEGFTVDPLLMDGYRNQKTYQNISLEVDVSFDRAKVGDGASYMAEYAVTQQVYEPVRKALKESEYGYRINTLRVNCKDLEGNLRNTDGDDPSDNIREVNTSYSCAAPQTDEEMYVQTIAYDFTSAFNQEYFSDVSYYFPYGEIYLRRFGISPGSDELYIEIVIYTVGGADDTEQADFKASLEGRSADLADAITGDDAALQYLKDNGASAVTVAFYTPWEAQGNYFYTYSYLI